MKRLICSWVLQQRAEQHLHLGRGRREVRELDRALVATGCELLAGVLVAGERVGE